MRRIEDTAFRADRRRSDPVKRGYVRSCHFRGGNVCGGQLTGRMQSWYQDLLEDRLTHCGHLSPYFA